MKQKITPKLFIESYNLDSSILLNLSQFFLSSLPLSPFPDSPNDPEAFWIPVPSPEDLLKQPLSLIAKIFKQVNEERVLLRETLVSLLQNKFHQVICKSRDVEFLSSKIGGVQSEILC